LLEEYGHFDKFLLICRHLLIHFSVAITCLRLTNIMVPGREDSSPLMPKTAFRRDAEPFTSVPHPLNLSP
jgi:hypothetical protein